MTDNVTPIGSADPTIKRALQLAVERLVRNHKAEFKQYLRQELRRTGGGPEGGAA